MAGKGSANESYRVHGNGVETLPAGFDEIGMPKHRQSEALAIVREVAGSNVVREFRWYKYESKDELCCYWDDHTANVLWITATNVHIPADASIVRRPQRTLSWKSQDGVYVGWRLSGAQDGAGGGRQRPQATKVRCPVSFLWLPAGSVCPDCEIAHTE